MSPEFPQLALGTLGAGCAAGGLILWLFPPGKIARVAAWIAGGVGLTGLLAVTGLDSGEDRIRRWLDARLMALSDGPWELVLVGVLILVGMAVFAISLASSFLWLGEAFEGKNRKRKTALVCASIGAFGWAVSVLHLGGFFAALWRTDLFAGAEPPRGLVEGGLTVLDMTGLVAALTLSSRERKMKA